MAEKMRNYVLTLFLVLVLLGMTPMLCASGARDVNGIGQAEKEQTDMDFTVCEAGRLPAELVELHTYAVKGNVVRHKRF